MEVSLNLILGILIALASFAAAMTVLYLIFYQAIPFADRLLTRTLYGDEDEHASDWRRRS